MPSAGDSARGFSSRRYAKSIACSFLYCLLSLLSFFIIFQYEIVHSQTVPISGNLVTVGHTNYCSDTGSTDAYACSLDYTVTTYITGARYTFRANTVNTGAATLNLNGIGAKAITRVAGGVTTPLLDGDICAGQDVEVVYDGTQMQMVSQRCTAAWTGPTTDMGGQVYNVKAYGALGNGSADDTEAIRVAYAAAGVTMGVLYFPPGTYMLSDKILLNQPNVLWRGAGMHASVLKATAAIWMTWLPAVPTAGATNPTFEDLGFDGNNFSATAYVDDASRNGVLTFRRCRFSQLHTGVVIYASQVVFDGNLCEGVGTGTPNTCLGLSAGAAGPLSNLKITNNRTRYTYQGLLANTDGTSGVHTTNPITNVEYAGNFTDLGWYTLPVRLTDTGAGITYTATTLSNTDPTLTGLTPNDYIRVMQVRYSGTAEGLAWTKLTDNEQNFNTGGNVTLPGEIVRVGEGVGGKFAIITAVDATTPNTLYVEEWLDDVTRAVVSAPPANSTYTVYKVILGKYTSGSSTTVNVVRWHDLTGADVTPAAGTRYELLYIQPNYGFHCEPGCNDWRIINNTHLRAYSDQISYWGTHAVIMGNYVAWGQDMGIVVHGASHTVTGNHVHKQGVGGITTVGVKNSTITANSVTNTTWTTTVGGDQAGGIAHDGLYGNVVSANVVAIDPPQSMDFANVGIVVQSAPNDNNLVIGNQTRGHKLGGIAVNTQTGLPTNVRLAHNVSTSEPKAVVYGADVGGAFAKVVVEPHEKKIVKVECIADATDISTGTGKCYLQVDAAFDKWVVSAVSATVGSQVATGAMTIGIDICSAVTGLRCAGASTIRALLTTNMGIDANEAATLTGTAGTLSTALATVTVLNGEWIRVNVPTAAATVGKGLYVTLVLENNRPGQ